MAGSGYYTELLINTDPDLAFFTLTEIVNYFVVAQLQFVFCGLEKRKKLEQDLRLMPKGANLNIYLYCTGFVQLTNV